MGGGGGGGGGKRENRVSMMNSMPDRPYEIGYNLKLQSCGPNLHILTFQIGETSIPDLPYDSGIDRMRRKDEIKRKDCDATTMNERPCQSFSLQPFLTHPASHHGILPGSSIVIPWQTRNKEN